MLLHSGTPSTSDTVAPLRTTSRPLINFYPRQHSRQNAIRCLLRLFLTRFPFRRPNLCHVSRRPLRRCLARQVSSRPHRSTLFRLLWSPRMRNDLRAPLIRHPRPVRHSALPLHWSRPHQGHRTWRASSLGPLRQLPPDRHLFPCRLMFRRPRLQYPLLLLLRVVSCRLIRIVNIINVISPGLLFRAQCTI